MTVVKGVGGVASVAGVTSGAGVAGVAGVASVAGVAAVASITGVFGVADRLACDRRGVADGGTSVAAGICAAAEISYSRALNAPAMAVAHNAAFISSVTRAAAALTATKRRNAKTGAGADAARGGFIDAAAGISLSADE